MKGEILRSVLGQINDSMNHAQKSMAYFIEKSELFGALLDDLDAAKINIVYVSASAGYFDVNFTGTRKDYVNFLRICGERGLRRDRIPENEDKATSVYGFLEGPNLKIWMNFTSTSCKRVKTGTKMVEQDVFDIVCNDGELFSPPVEENLDESVRSEVPAQPVHDSAEATDPVLQSGSDEEADNGRDARMEIPF